MAPPREIEFRTFLFRYRHEGETWALKLRARDEADAKIRLRQLTNAVYDGELMIGVPIPHLRGWERIKAWLAGWR